MDVKPFGIKFPAWTLVNIASFKEHGDLTPRLIAPQATVQMKLVFLLFTMPNVAKSSIDEMDLPDTAVLKLKTPAALRKLLTASIQKLECTHVGYNTTIDKSEMKMDFYPIYDVLNSLVQTS